MVHPSEMMIRQDINELDEYRLAPRKKAIKIDIKYAYWHGFINEKIYNDLLEELQRKTDTLYI